MDEHFVIVYKKTIFSLLLSICDRIFLIQQRLYLYPLTTMRDRSLSTSRPESVIQPPIGILPVKSILALLKQQINMRSLTSAIRQYCIEQRQVQSRDSLLAFFLACERKLKKNTQQQWNRVIDCEIKKTLAVQKVGKMIVRWANRAFFNRLTKVQIELGDLGELGQLQISEEVHIKTKYFFQWFQFLQEKRQIKRMKNKQIQDIKKSRLFSQYSCKFHTFVQWKQISRKIKSERDRAIMIEKATEKRLVLSAITKIKEKIDIFNIQNQLQKIVGEKLSQLSTKSVFDKLRGNIANEQNRGNSLKKLNNIWVFRLYKFISRRFTPLQTLSSIKIRDNLQGQYDKLCMQRCWRGFRLQINKKRAIMQKINTLIKSKAALEWIKIQKSKLKCKKGGQALKKLKRQIYLKQFFINVQEGNQVQMMYSNKIEQVREYQKLMLSKLVFSTLTAKYTSIKSIKSKLNSYNSYFLKHKKQKFINNLHNNKDKKSVLSQKTVKATTYVSTNFFLFKLKLYKNHISESSKLKESLKIMHEKYLQKISLKALGLYKQVIVSEHQAINNLVRTLELKKLSEGFTQIKQYSYLSYKLQKLAKTSQWIVLKVSFITILNKMLKNKIRIKNFYSQQQKKLKGKLFSLLKANKQFVKEQKQKIQQINLNYSKSSFITSLIKEKQHRQKLQLLTKQRQIFDKRTFFKTIFQKQSKKQDIQQNKYAVSEMLVCSRIIDFVESSKEFLAYRENENKLIFKVQKNIVKGFFKNLKRKIVQKHQQKISNLYIKEDHYKKIQKIREGFTSKCLIKLLRVKKTTLEKNQSKLKRFLSHKVFQLLNFNLKKITISKQIQAVKKASLFPCMKYLHVNQQNNAKLLKKLIKDRKKQAISTFKQNTFKDFQQREQKIQKLQNYLQYQRTIKIKAIFINKMQKDSQMKQNMMILQNTILKNRFQRLFKAYLNHRSNQIKDIIALRLYASNIKRKALKGLRRVSDAIILKQNRAKTQYHSKLSAEKSMDHMRKKSKIMQTIERYNQSRISRVVR